MVGCIVWGHLECYFIMGPQLAKGSGMEATIVSRVLDLVHQKLAAANHPMPRVLIVAADNTTKEAKNQHFATYLAYLLATHKFDSTECQFMKSGHTRNEQD